MMFGQKSRTFLAAVLAAIVARPPVSALVTLNDSHDHIYIDSSFGISRDSNVFANSDNAGDFVYSAGFVAEYTRRAGWIGMNASVAVSASRYGKIKNQNFSNPNYSLELTKQTGRTTGSFTLSGARESRADAAVNLRSSSWNYNAGLNFAYPIINRLKLSGGLGYSARKYIDKTALANLSTYTANADLFYILTGERDLIGGYRYRYSETSLSTATTDHALTAGLNGRIVRGLNGTVRVGYQFRVPHGAGSGGSTYSAFTASGSTSYSLTRKLKVSSQISKDFSTTATDASVDTTGASIDVSYAYNSRWSGGLSGGWGDSRFLGESGRIILATRPTLLLGVNRHDSYANWSAHLSYARSEHFGVSAGYTWFENWSTISYADFIRTGWNLNLSSRW
jgi:hypothetical protein